MKNVTYLLGAGASAPTLPVIDQLPVCLKAMATAIRGVWKISDSEITKVRSTSEYSIIEKIASDMEWLAEVSSEHASVDTFARKLAITERKANLKKLKNVLSMYFILEEASRKVEMRYDTFLASLLQKKNNKYNFPDNVRVISWNYDNQLEKAYHSFINTNQAEVFRERRELNHLSKYNMNYFNPDEFSITKLNGSCGIYNIKEKQEYELIGSFFSPEINPKQLALIYGAFSGLLHQESELKSSISFAWESELSDNNNFIQKILPAIYNTEILVVIGYSFPFFNREVDRKIFNSMTDLKKVYFQSPEADLLVDKFASVRDAPVSEMIKIGVDKKQFFLPPEL